MVELDKQLIGQATFTEQLQAYVKSAGLYTLFTVSISYFIPLPS